MAVVLKRHRFTLEEYQRMVEADILPDDARVELIEGEVIEMAPIGLRHAATVDRLTRLFTSRLGERVIVRVQGPVAFPAVVSQLQPDVAVLRARADFYVTRHPDSPDLVLVVEVMDSSVELDRRVKLPLYARAGVAEVWLVDVTVGRMEVYRAPVGGRYTETQTYEHGASAGIAAFPEVTLAVDDVLGPPAR
jgi:Uma2 family endonuclease